MRYLVHKSETAIRAFQSLWACQRAPKCKRKKQGTDHLISEALRVRSLDPTTWMQRQPLRLPFAWLLRDLKEGCSSKARGNERASAKRHYKNLQLLDPEWLEPLLAEMGVLKHVTAVLLASACEDTPGIRQPADAARPGQASVNADSGLNSLPRAESPVLEM